MRVDDSRIHSRIRNTTLILIVLAAALLAASLLVSCARSMGARPSDPGSGLRVATADGRDYFPIVHGLLAGAGTSIDAVLYQSRFYFEYPLSSSNTLIADLADASSRGVRVRVVLEVADWNYGNSEDNRDVADVLRDAGVDIYFDPVGTTSHSKLLVVDGVYSVVGSMNWSYYALDKNVEATAVIASGEIARAFTAYFDGIVAASTRDYTLPLAALRAADVPLAGGEDVVVTDVVDSAAYSPADTSGRLYLDEVTVLVREDALEEVLALDSLFFERVAGDTVRVFGETDRDTPGVVRALDVKTGATRRAMLAAFAGERTRLKASKASSVPKAALAWTDAVAVIPLPNDTYAPEVGKRIRQARDRVWLALLDARYYDKRPQYAESAAPRGPDGTELPSLSNALLADLVEAAGRGVDVRLVIDMGRGWAPPASKAAFLDRLKAAGGKVYEDSPDVTTHAKLLIIDDGLTVVGSTNWSQPALEENNETSVLIEAPAVNARYAGLIEQAAGGFDDD